MTPSFAPVPLILLVLLLSTADARIAGGCGCNGINTAYEPTFSPPPGSYTTPQTVTLLDATVGAAIHYTLDGSTPTPSSTLYTAPISITVATTINAIATAVNFNQSPMASAFYSIPLGQVPYPQFTPLAGTYSSAQSVAISDTTPSSTIYYTTDGSTPTTGSAVYSTPLTVNSTETINAFATATGYLNSIIASATFTISLQQAATPTFAPVAGTYSGSQTVYISDITPGPQIYYTTDGSTPTTASTFYTTGIVVGSTEVLKAIVTASHYSQSNVGSALYTIVVPTAATPTFSPSGGAYTSIQSVTVSDTTPSATLYCTTDGSTPTTASPVCSNPIIVSATETIKALATAPGYINSTVGSATYTITLSVAQTPTFSPVAGTYPVTQTVSISDATPSPTIYYTTDGSTPTTGSTVYTTALTVSATTTVKAIATASGYTQSAVGSALYTIGSNGPLLSSNLAALPNAKVGTAYSTNIVMSAGAGAPYTSYALTNYSSDQKAANGTYAAPTPGNTWAINSSTGALTSTPAASENDYFLITANDHTGASVFEYFSVNVSTGTNPMVIANHAGLGNFPQGDVYTSGSPAITLTAVGGTGSLTWSITSQTSTQTNNAWSIGSSTGAITGTATNPGVNTLNISVHDTASHTATASLYLTVNPYVTGAPRPSYNTGSGFFVRDGELYDSNGNLFRMRGTNRAHYGGASTGWAEPQSGFNTVRFELYTCNTTELNLVSIFQAQHLNVHQFVIAMRYYDSACGTSTGSSNLGMQTGTNASGLGNLVNLWVNNYSAYSPVMNKIAINVANEWGPTNSFNWQYGYAAVSGNISNVSGTTITLSNVSGANPFANSLGLTLAYIKGATGLSNQLVTITGVGGSSGAWTVTTSTTLTGWSSGGVLWGGAIGILRAVGYSCPIMIDSGTSGQDYNDITNYSAAVFNSDPQKNIIFSYHLYGNTTTYSTFTNALAAWNTLRTANGMVYGVYEFGPYLYPTQDSFKTQFPTQQILNTLESYGMGNAGWAMDDNDGSNNQADDNSFAMKYQNADNGYPSNKTVWGKYIALDPIYGAMANAIAASSL